MKTRKVAPALMATVALCLCIPALHAENAKIFVMGGGSSFLDTNYFEHNTVSYESSYKKGGRGIIGAEAPVSKLFGLEGAFAYGRSNFVITNFSTNPVAQTAYGVRNLRSSGNLVGHSPITFRGWRPYATVGIELDSFLLTNKAIATSESQGFAGAPSAILRSQDKVGVNFGAGLEWKITSRLKFRIDLREHMFHTPTYAVPASAASISDPIFPVSGMARNLEYSVGIVYFIHRPRK